MWNVEKHKTYKKPFYVYSKTQWQHQNREKLITNSETICVIVLVSLSRIVFDTKEENKIPLKEGTLKKLDYQ